MSQIDPGTPTWLRTHNDRTAFRLLLEHGPLTRTQLGELSGMSKPTAAQMISRLERVELIHAVGEVSGGRGPNAVSYGVRTDRILGVAVSVLADGSHAVVVDASDADHPIVEIPHGSSGRTPEDDIRRAVRAASEAAGVDPASVSHVVVGVQAAVFPERDSLSLTDTLPGWPAVGARERIERALAVQVVVENDVNLAAIAERAVGVAADASSFAVFWIGHGLGVGIDLDGTVHRGASGGAGEIGYLEASRSALRLVPSAGDFTDLLGGPAVARLLGAHDGEGLADVLPRLTGDEAALSAIAERVAITIRPVLSVLDPALIVLAGPTSLAGGDALAELVAERIDRSAHPMLAVRRSGTGDQPVLLGARRLLVDRIRDLLEADITTAA